MRQFSRSELQNNAQLEYVQYASGATGIASIFSEAWKFTWRKLELRKLNSMHLSGVKIHFRPHRILSMVQVVYLPRFVRMHVEHSLDLRWFTVAERSFSHRTGAPPHDFFTPRGRNPDFSPQVDSSFLWLLPDFGLVRLTVCIMSRRSSSYLLTFSLSIFSGMAGMLEPIIN